MQEKTSSIFLGFDFRIDGDDFILDKELVLDLTSGVQWQLPWKRGDRFELVVEDERTIFRRI